jgi:hypothetical protein
MREPPLQMEMVFFVVVVVVSLKERSSSFIERRNRILVPIEGVGILTDRHGGRMNLHSNRSEEYKLSFRQFRFKVNSYTSKSTDAQQIESISQSTSTGPINTGKLTNPGHQI